MSPRIKAIPLKMSRLTTIEAKSHTQSTLTIMVCEASHTERYVVLTKKATPRSVSKESTTVDITIASIRCINFRSTASSRPRRLTLPFKNCLSLHSTHKQCFLDILGLKFIVKSTKMSSTTTCLLAYPLLSVFPSFDYSLVQLAELCKRLSHK